jgi:N-acetylglutamate synthase-like GNAT family acetyltransferase
MSTTADTSATRRVIREARASDADRVFALLKQLEQGYAPDRESFDESFAFLVDGEPTSVLLVAEDEAGFVLGYALTTISPLLHTNGKSAQLQELVVDRDHRASGVGTSLVEEVERVCRDRGVRQLTVPSRRSADFYERIGYRSTADFLKRTLD